MQEPDLTFYNLGIAPKMLDQLNRMKFERPTPIQYKAIPIANKGSDVVGIAQTGTGKTLAFGIPTIQRLGSTNGDALVLVPTRELALQVNQALGPLVQPFGMKSCVLIGGASMHMQIKALRRRPRIVIATPGRLIDLMQQRNVNLSQMNTLILDEADRMFDMGFQPQVEQVLRQFPKKRQTMLFSATMPPDIIRLATKHMKLPIHVEIAPSGTAAEHVTHELFIIKEEAKKTLLRHLLHQYCGSVLIFARTRRKASRIMQVVKKGGHKVAVIHSDRTMGQRKQAIDGFKTGQYRVLVATDIAARGIDVSSIEVVINFDMPDDTENYVHRIGRTGRAGNKGHAILFAAPDQGLGVSKIEKLIKKSLPRGKNPEVETHQFDAPEVRSFYPRGRGGKGGQFFRRGRSGGRWNR